MDHQPFEQWILDQNIKTKQQEILLQDHLIDCPSCSALMTSWKNVEHELQTASMVAPAPGFLARWQLNLANKKAIQHQIQAIKTFIGISCAILITIAALLAWLVLTNSVSDVIVGGVNFFTGFLQTYFNVRGMFAYLLQQAPPFAPYLFWIMATGWGTIITGLWGLTIWRVSQRGTIKND